MNLTLPINHGATSLQYWYMLAANDEVSPPKRLDKARILWPHQNKKQIKNFTFNFSQNLRLRN